MIRWSVALLMALATPAAAQPADPAAMRFAFTEKHDGFTPVAQGAAYDATTGYGWDDPARFSVKVPEGNYRVTLTFASGEPGATTTVKAESRRLMGEVVAGAEPTATSYIVNVRTAFLEPPPENAPGGPRVLLKPREVGSLTWDDRLTLEFLGDGPRPTSLVVEPVEVPTIYLAGDSTVTDQQAEPAASWGQMLTRFFGPTVAVANHAESGETLKSFTTELRLAKMLSRMKEGDWLLIQFGHNDQKRQWPQTYVEAGSTYRAWLKTFIAEARLRGATPMLVTSPERRNFDAEGRIVPSHGDYPAAVRAVAEEEGVGLVDLTPMTVAFYEALGPDRSPLAFSDGGADRTHHNNYGAHELARMVAASLVTADPQLARHLVPEARTYDPAKPLPPERFNVAESGARSDVRPDGS